jgi:hypothetical protein
MQLLGQWSQYIGRAFEQKEFPLRDESGGNTSQKEEIKVLSVEEVVLGGWLINESW